MSEPGPAVGTAGDEWDFADWGTPGRADGPDGPDGSDPDGPDAWPLPTPGAHRTPYAPGALRLPELDVGGLRPDRTPTAGRLDAVLIGAARVSAAVAAAAVLLGSATISVVAFVAAGLWLGLLGVALVIGRRNGAFAVVLWIVPVGLIVGGLTSVAVTDGVGSPAGGALLGGTALGCVTFGWWRARRARRSAPSIVRHRDAAHVAHRTDLHVRARAWNLVRQALTTPGSSVERLTASGMSAQAGRWLGVDPRSGQMTVRPLDLDVPVNSWVALDADGQVLAVAPPGAPEAWSTVIRRRPDRGPAR